MSQTSIQISTRKQPHRVTPEQERFSFLIREIEKVRAEHATLESEILKYRSAYMQRVQPLRGNLTDVCRATVFALDRLLDEKGWSRTEAASLRDVLCGNAQMLLETNSADVEMRTLFDKHSAIDFEQVQQERIERLKEEAEEFAGIDLGDEEFDSEAELIQRMRDEMAQREEAGEARSRKSATSKRSEDHARLARDALREIYRKLASAVHPDRESDPERRAEKNALMQRINQAYANNDLLTLFEAQMQLQQWDAAEIGTLGADRLKRYNKLLAEQLTQLRGQIREVTQRFFNEQDVPAQERLTPKVIELLLRQQARDLRAEVARQKQFLDVLATKASVKRWLKMQRQAARAFFDDDE